MDILNGMNNYIDSGKRVIEIEAAALTALLPQINGEFSQACELMLNCKGRVVITGMGKSGHIGNKFAATLASTGTPSFFVHPGEASHGDMGMITADDVVIAMSNSGETAEVTSILPLIKRKGAPLIAMTGNPQSTMAKVADVSLNTGVEKEACSLDLAPTASTTVTLAMGDALAIALLDARGFTADDFALSHPGGSLGRRLLLHISDIMHSGEDIPRVAPDASVSDALLEMTRGKLGITVVYDDEMQVIGVFTDGDLRRVLSNGQALSNQTISDVMTSPCLTIEAGKLAVEAVNLMQDKAINALPVVNSQQQLLGVINVHDLLRAGVM